MAATDTPVARVPSGGVAALFDGRVTVPAIGEWWNGEAMNVVVRAPPIIGTEVQSQDSTLWTDSVVETLSFRLSLTREHVGAIVLRACVSESGCSLPLLVVMAGGCSVVLAKRK